MLLGVWPALTLIDPFVPIFFFCLPPFLFILAIVLHLVNSLPGKRVITNGSDEWCLCLGKAAFSSEQAGRQYPIPCASEVPVVFYCGDSLSGAAALREIWWSLCWQKAKSHNERGIVLLMKSTELYSLLLSVLCFKAVCTNSCSLLCFGSCFLCSVLTCTVQLSGNLCLSSFCQCFVPLS